MEVSRLLLTLLPIGWKNNYRRFERYSAFFRVNLPKK